VDHRRHCIHLGLRQLRPPGAARAQRLVLGQVPYSKKQFSVPANVYLIGTMNTADRSLAAMDVALRRRFVFREMPSRPALLKSVEVGAIRIDELLLLRPCEV
jgi:5-methylcytosine-specific restriction protein B